MNLNLFLAALRARPGVFALVLGATILAATVVSLVLPKTYKATVSLVVDAKEEQSLSNVLHPLMAPLERIGYLQTQVDILTSEKVARKVVRDLKLAESPTVREAYEDEAAGAGSIEDWLAQKLLRYLKVETAFRRRSPTRSPRPISTRRSSCAWSRRSRRRPGSTSS